MGLDFSIAVFQMTSVDDIQTNFEKMSQLISNLSPGKHYDLLCFPENCLYMRLREGEKINGIEINHPTLLELSKICKNRNLNIHLGSIPLKIDDKMYNASVLLKNNGSVDVSYKKIHLFDISLKNRLSIRESDIFESGTDIGIFEINGWKIGQSICYDIRFSELFSLYAAENVDLLLVPAAFLKETGRAHWEILLRARAIESQCYLAASAQGGLHQNSQGDLRETFGHSMVVGPWGDILQKLDIEVGVLELCLKKADLDQVRTQIPMKNHRKIRK